MPLPEIIFFHMNSNNKQPTEETARPNSAEPARAINSAVSKQVESGAVCSSPFC